MTLRTYGGPTVTDREPSTARRCAMIRQCRVRRQEAGCPCDGACLADLMAGRDHVRYVPPIGDFESRVRRTGGWL